MRRDSTKDVRERLLEAGVATFHRLGFNGCSVQDITEAAGVPKGSFYNHFESKEALGAAALEHFWQDGACDRLQILSEPGRAPSGGLHPRSPSRRRDQHDRRSRDARQFRPERLGGRRPARPHREDGPPAAAVPGRPLHPPPALTSAPRFFSTGNKMTGHLNNLAPAARRPKTVAEPSALLPDAPVRRPRSFPRRENSIKKSAPDHPTAAPHLRLLARGHRASRAEGSFAAPTPDTCIRQEIR